MNYICGWMARAERGKDSAQDWEEGVCFLVFSVFLTSSVTKIMFGLATRIL